MYCPNFLENFNPFFHGGGVSEVFAAKHMRFETLEILEKGRHLKSGPATQLPKFDFFPF